MASSFLNLYAALLAIRRVLMGTISSFTSRLFSLRVVPVSTISTMTSDSPSIGASSIGYDCKEWDPDNRKLVFSDEAKGVSYFWVKPSDVAIYE